MMEGRSRGKMKEWGILVDVGARAVDDIVLDFGGNGWNRGI